MPKSQIKTTLITFFNIKDTVHFEFIPQGKTVNQAYYSLAQQLDSLHHDNYLAHKAFSIKQFLAPKSITEMKTHHIPLIWFRRTSNCFKNKACLKGFRIFFKISKKVTTLKAISQQEFQKCSQQ
jgi:hypothetical protein